ncbi:hypothetical protein [Halodurantibacterium flavum]|uniref:Sulfotransferase domain-containing protein n=1 Tax=Halodurantibacterium flavum TaxID=1382802 RepID=A0ABW4S349_9RHOB
MKSIILYTTPTSGTGSLTRIVERINAGRMTFRYYFRDVLQRIPREEIERTFPPPEGHILLHNDPGRFNRNMDLSAYRFIVNFRDPRDRLCNVYHWQFSHPHTHETEAETAARRAAVAEEGIDRWILRRIEKRSERRYYDPIFWLLDNAPPENVLVATYAQLCCDFDAMLGRLQDFMGMSPNEKGRRALELERPEGLQQNPRWIGNKWPGSDIMPGRFLNELAPETIAALNDCYRPVLRRMARHDPQFAPQYLAGIGRPGQKGAPKAKGRSDETA